jgi:hypothetical protein
METNNAPLKSQQALLCDIARRFLQPIATARLTAVATIFRQLPPQLLYLCTQRSNLFLQFLDARNRSKKQLYQRFLLKLLQLLAVN